LPRKVWFWHALVFCASWSLPGHLSVFNIKLVHKGSHLDEFLYYLNSMKTYTHWILKAAFFIACLKLQSQTLTCQYNCPKPGQLFSIKTSSPVAATQGINKVWNFTQVQSVSTSAIMVSYVTPSTTPSASAFTQATVAKSQSGKYTFLETGSGEVKISTANNVTVNAQSVILPLPFHYGSSHTETINTSYYSGTTKIEVLKTKKLNGVGTGTLMLPTGTYTDVLLISGQSVESVTVAGVPDGNVVTNKFSYFYSERIPHPLLYTEQKSETGPMDYGPYTEFIASLETDITSESKESYPEIQLAPNPCSDFVNISASVNELYGIYIINTLGEKVLNLHYSGGSTDVDLRDLPVGLYTVFVLHQNSTQSRKLIISR
jgi:hypothetical protein